MLVLLNTYNGFECVILHIILNKCFKYYIYYFIPYYIDVFIFLHDK